MPPRNFIDSLTRQLGRRLSFDRAIGISRTLMETKGFGSGALVSSSGERGVFNLISGPSPVLFDVGGYRGAYTEAFLKAHPDGLAWILEPSQHHCRVLADRFGKRDNVTLIRSGLSNQAGDRPLYKHADMSALASLTKRRLDHFQITMDNVEIVNLRTLDDVLSQYDVPSIDILKIDVEGHELDVLNGSSQTFQDGRIKLVQFEFGGCNLDTRTSVQDFFYFFKQYSFTIGVVQPSCEIHWLPAYDEVLEQYRTTNFVATARP